MITTKTRSLAEVWQFCPICGRLITPGSTAGVRWPRQGPVIEADFRRHELVFKRDQRPADPPG